MSFPFNIGTPYPCGDGLIVCTEVETEYQPHRQRVSTFTLKAYGDIFRDLSTPPTTGPAARPEPEPIPRRVVQDTNGRPTYEVIFNDWGPLAQSYVEERIRRAAHIYSDGQFTPIATPAARTPACLVDALCRRGRFLTLPAPPPGETGA